MSKKVHIKKYRTTSVDKNNNDISFSSGASGGDGTGAVNNNFVKKTGDTMTGSLTTPVVSASKIIANRPYIEDDFEDAPSISDDPKDTEKPVILIEDDVHFNPEALSGMSLRFANEDIYHGHNANNDQTDWRSRTNTSRHYVAKESIVSDDYNTGLTGQGFGISKKANGRWGMEIGSLTLHEFLEAAEFRFNRIDMVSGDMWNAIAFGLIEDVDTINQIVTVKLLEGELLSSHIGDINRGTFYNLGSTSDNEDSNGFLQIKGFATSYFTPTELLPDGKSFRYELQADTTYHPCKAMKFVSYGNFIDKTRQASAYSTRTYQRYLSGVNTWTINPDKNITAQFGDLDGLTIGGVTMQGYGSFQKNVYLTGTHIQFTPEQIEEMQGRDAYNVSLSSYEGVIKLNQDGAVSDLIRELKVTTGGKNVMTGDSNVTTKSYTLTTRIQAFKGERELYYNIVPIKGTYNVSLSPYGCDAIVSAGVLTIINITDPANCYVEIAVNCEGNAIFSKRYTITALADGQDAIQVNVYSDSGNSFINNNIAATLVAQVMRGGEDITDTIPPNLFNWSRKSENISGDKIWNELHQGVGSAIIINNEDVYRKASFECNVLI